MAYNNRIGKSLCSNVGTSGFLVPLFRPIITTLYHVPLFRQSIPSCILIQGIKMLELLYHYHLLLVETIKYLEQNPNDSQSEDDSDDNETFHYAIIQPPRLPKRRSSPISTTSRKRLLTIQKKAFFLPMT